MWVILLIIIFRIVRLLLEKDKEKAINKGENIAKEFLYYNLGLLNLEHEKFINPEIIKKAYDDIYQYNFIESDEIQITVIQKNEITAAKTYLIDRCNYLKAVN